VRGRFSHFMTGVMQRTSDQAPIISVLKDIPMDARTHSFMVTDISVKGLC